MENGERLYNYCTSSEYKEENQMGISPEITITINPNFIEFQWKENLIRLEPYVNMDMNKRSPVRIGENSEYPNTVLVGVFDPKSEIPSYPDKFPFLQMIFEYGIGKMFEKQHLPMLKPIMIVRGIDSLKEVFFGYQHALIYTALIKAHAQTVRFE
jgi:hypothetical protein